MYSPPKIGGLGGRSSTFARGLFNLIAGLYNYEQRLSSGEAISNFYE